MAKGKSLNPADAQRKAERKKELKKNKTERQKNRDFALVKKDTTSIEEDVQRLQKAETDGVISGPQKTELSSLRAELTRINKKKDEWVSEHPEHRKLVYRARYKKSEQEAGGQEGERKIKERKVFDKNGIPRHPERSVYYDPIMNPFGVPPPGMPYMERPLQPDEVDSQAEDQSDEEGEGGSGDEIAMPSGPPPPAKPENDSEDSDDEIPMPEGPAPSQLTRLPPLPPPPLPPPPLPSGSSVPQTHTSPLPHNVLPPPPPPPGFPAVPPAGFPPFPPHPYSHTVPPPPPGFPVPPLPSGIGRHPPGWTNYLSGSHSRLQSNGSMQDPLASVPHQTFQAYRAQQGNASHPLPDKPAQDTATNQLPPAQSSTQSVSSTEASTISAPPQLRDLKKESTAFVPSSLKRKKTGGATNASGKSTASRINAAPEANDADKTSGGGEAEAARPDLLGALKTKFPAPSTNSGTTDVVVKKRKLEIPEVKKGKDDYEKFIEEIGDIL